MIKSLANSSITNQRKYRSMMAGSVENNADHLITETVLGSAVSSVTFDVSSLAALGYKHLQIRHVSRSDTSGSQTVAAFRFNGDSGFNYSVHRMTANGSSVTSGGNASNDWGYAGIITASGSASGNFGVAILDILDFASSVKNKTTRCFTGNTGGNEIDLYSSAWLSTSPITSIVLYPYNGSFIANSRLSLYASKG